MGTLTRRFELAYAGFIGTAGTECPGLNQAAMGITLEGLRAADDPR